MALQTLIIQAKMAQHRLWHTQLSIENQDKIDYGNMQH